MNQQGKLNTEHMSIQQKKFKAGMILQQASFCDSDCVFGWTVVRRTKKQLVLEQYGKQYRVKIHTDVRDESEVIFPNGKYSMCPVCDVDDCANKEDFPEVFGTPEAPKAEEAPAMAQNEPESDDSSEEAPTAHNRIKTPESVHTEHSDASVKHASGLLSELLDKKADGATKYALMGAIQLASIESRN